MELAIFISSCIEASLAHIDAVSSHLAEVQIELQKEIDSLRSELASNQEPEKMQLIQEMISVCCGSHMSWIS
jgi:hypothetical protein